MRCPVLMGPKMIVGVKNAIARDTTWSVFAVFDPNAMTSRFDVVVKGLCAIARYSAGLAISFIARTDVTVLLAFKLELLVSKNRSFLFRKSVDLFLYWNRRRQRNTRNSVCVRREWKCKYR